MPPNAILCCSERNGTNLVTGFAVDSCLSAKLGAVVRPYMCRRAAGDEQLRQRGKDVLMPQLTCHDKRQAFPASLIDNGQDAELAVIVRAPLDEVVSPHMPWILRPQADA